jgi:hypothetical protein
MAWTQYTWLIGEGKDSIAALDMLPCKALADDPQLAMASKARLASMMAISHGMPAVAWVAVTASQFLLLHTC